MKQGVNGLEAHLVCRVTVRNYSVCANDDTVNVVVLEQAAQHRVA
jgi:hypothetical protein